MDLMRTLLIYMSATLTLAVQSTTAPKVTPTPSPVPETTAVVETVKPGGEAEETPAPEETKPAENTDKITPFPVPTITPNQKGYFNLGMNAKGKEVRRLQEKLIELGYLAEGSADGSYGRQTYNAVKKFQYYNGLTADGIAGRSTQTNLFENPAVVPNPEVSTITPKPTKEPAKETTTPKPTKESSKETATPKPTKKSKKATPTPKATKKSKKATPTPKATKGSKKATPTPKPTKSSKKATPTPKPTKETQVTAAPAQAEAPTEAPVEIALTEATATEIPVTEIPETETPVTAGPVTEAPVTEVPVTENPETEAPVTETPAAEESATEAPAAETPAAGEPAAETPVTEAPAAAETEALPAEIPELHEDVDLDADIYEPMTASVALNESYGPLEFITMEDGVPVTALPRLSQYGEKIRISLDDLCACVDGWELTDDGVGTVVLEAAGYTLALYNEDQGCSASLDGQEIAMQEDDFDFSGDGHFINAQFLAKALKGEAVWDYEENTLMLRIRDKDAVESAD